MYLEELIQKLNEMYKLHGDIKVEKMYYIQGSNPWDDIKIDEIIEYIHYDNEENKIVIE